MLIADLGGPGTVTTAQSQVVEVASRTKLLLDSIDAWLVQQPRLVNGRTRACFPVVVQRQRIADALVNHLETLGLERRGPRTLDLARALAERPRESDGDGDDHGGEERRRGA